MINKQELIQQLEWRYAVKKFDSSRQIPNETWDALEESLVLTPSSYGLQPWKFLVITNQELKNKLVPHSWGQKQVADCSHFVVFTIKKNLNEKNIDEFLARTVEVRGGNVESLAGYKKMMMGDVVNGPRGKIVNEWATRQAYIALGNLMTSAALLGIDTCPMEGILPEEYDRILNLTSQGLATVVACAVGYRSADDNYALAKKVRFKKEVVIESL